MPEALDELERRIRQPEIEREAIKRENDDDKLKELIRHIKEMESKGYSYDGADASFELLARQVFEDVPEFFLRAAFCLHETGDTLAACNQLLRGPKELFDMAIFHYNLACYLWTLGDGPRARSHLQQAIEMDGTYLESAREDRDLAGMNLPLA